MWRRVLLVGIACLLGATAAQGTNASAISSTGCIDPTRFQSCIDGVTAVTVGCIKIAETSPSGVFRALAIEACGLGGAESSMNCYISSCWNKVYSCEYQALGVFVQSGSNGSASLPFYPAPDNAPGGCSCNVGKLYNIIQSYQLSYSKKCTYPAVGVSDLVPCGCCAGSGALSAFYSLCPDSDPTQIRYNEAVNWFKTSEAILGSNKCGSTFDASKCAAKYSFDPVPSGTFLAPDALPSWTGTKSLSNTGSALSTLPSSSTVTWTGLSYTFTATAEAFNAANAAATKTTAGSGSGSGASATAAGTAGSTTKAGSAATAAAGWPQLLAAGMAAVVFV